MMIALGSLAVILVLMRAMPKGALVEERAMSKRSPLRRVIIYAGALLLALFWFAPFVLVVIGSVMPEVNLLSFPPTWFADPPNLQTYDYIFTGKIPESYEQRGALRSMISNEVRDVPRAILNSSGGRHRGDVHQRDLRQPGGLCLRPPALSRARGRLQLRADEPAHPDRGHRRALLPDRAGLRADQYLLGADRDLLGPDAALHDPGADPLFPRACRTRSTRRRRSKAPPPGAS